MLLSTRPGYTVTPERALKSMFKGSVVRYAEHGNGFLKVPIIAQG